jgi:hypothetical protein
MGMPLQMVHGDLLSPIREISRPLANFLSLTQLPDNAPAILLSFIVFNVIHLLIAPRISEVLLRKRYTDMGKMAKNNWYVVLGLRLLGKI